MEEIGDFDQNVDMGLISTSISPDMHLHISQAVSLTLPIQTYVFVKSLTVASSPTSTTLPTSPTSLGKCFIKNCTPVVISFPPQAPAIQCLVQLALCNCNRRTGRLHQILSPHCLCRLVSFSRLSNEYIHQTSQQYETQQLGDLSNAPIWKASKVTLNFTWNERHNDLQNFYPTSTDVIYSATFFWLNWWDIKPPFMCCVFHHISDHLKRLILFLPI